MQTIKFFVITTFILWAFSATAKDKTITLTTLNWEPYIGEELKNQGYVAEIVREAFHRSGYQVDIKFMPWARAVQLAKNGEVDGYFPEYYAQEVTTHSQFSDAFPGGPMGFFKRKGSTINYQSIEDLKPYTIGVVRGYVNTAEFDAADYLQKDPVTNDTLNIRKLLGGRIDLFIADKFVGLYLLERDLPEKLGQIEFLEPPLELKDLFVCISKKTTDADKKLIAFNSGLKQMEQDGSLKTILNRHGF